MFTFDYTVKTSSRARNLRVSISGNGEVIVTKPRFVPQFLINSFLKEHEQWIIGHLHKTKQRIKAQDRLYYKGKPYQLDFSKGKLSFNFSEGKLQITSITPQIGLRTLAKKLREQAREVITAAVKEYALAMDLVVNSVRLKDQSSRWGSCSTKKNLNFSWRLIMAPPDCLTYVVIHELAHLRHMDHSKYFWQLVEKYDPDYREHRRWLHRHQEDLQLDFEKMSK